MAEGVETQEQLEVLAALDCDVAQGYLFARPLSARDAISQVRPPGDWKEQRQVAPAPTQQR